MARVQVIFAKDNPRAVSRTKKGFKNECDINMIMARARKGQLVPFAARESFCGDFDTAQDYFDIQKKKVDLDKQFMKLSAEVRARFDHNPGNLIAFLCDEKNADEAVKLGILAPKELSQAEKDAAFKASEDARIAKLKEDLVKAGVKPA